MKGRFALVASVAAVLAAGASSGVRAEDEPQYLSGAEAAQQQQQLPDFREFVSETELDAQMSQFRSEIRSLRDLTELRLNTLESSQEATTSYVEKLLFAFMVATGLVVFVVLVTLNKQSNVNNERMRNLIREAEGALDDLHRLMDRPEAEHFHVSRKLARIMNKLRERENPSLPQKEVSDIFAASEDPTLPVSLHLQANALRSEQRGDWNNAIHFWEKLLSIDDASPEVLLHLAQNYKRLAQVSVPERASKFREISLDYFQKYTVRTNLHTHSERELRQMASLGMTQGPVSQLYSSSEPVAAGAEGPAGSAPDAGQPVPAAPIPKKPAAAQAKSLSFQEYQDLKEAGAAKKPRKKRRKSTAESLLSVVPTVTRKLASGGGMTAKEAKAALQAKPAKAAAPSNGSESKPAKPAKAKPAPVAAPAAQGNGDAAPEAKAEEAPAPAPAVQAAPAPMAANGNGANGDAAAESGASGEEKAFKSRMDKAREHFGRYGSAKTKKDRMMWLDGAMEEFEAAAKYSTDVEMFRLWGMAALEKASVDGGNERDHVKAAIGIFELANESHEDLFCNEISLCHAMLGDEDGCRAALERASKSDALNPDVFLIQPDFEKYKGKPWFQELAKPFSN